MTIKSKFYEQFFLPIVCAQMIGIIVLDQLAKRVAMLELLNNSIALNNFLSLELSRNYGIAFGIVIPDIVFYAIVLAFIVAIASGKILDVKSLSKKELIGMGFIFSGAIANIIDRLTHGYIVDFINFKDIFIFNLADVFIVGGAVILLENMLPDTGKGNLKRSVYIALFMALGLLISFLVHAAIEIWYLDLLFSDFTKYSFGFSWQQLYIIHGIGTLILFIGGALFGYLQGKYWWKILYW